MSNIHFSSQTDLWGTPPIIDDRLEYKCAWNPLLKQNLEWPHSEPFDEWWHRCKALVGHLHPMVAEQWIYKYWDRSPYCYLPIENLAWTEQRWSNEIIINDVFVTPNWGPHNAEHDFEVYQKDRRFKDIPPFNFLRQNQTWDIPIVVLRTPDGVRSREKILPAKYCLIEGHVRIRALKAWHGRGSLAPEHSVFVLTLVERGEAAA
jgi:hypothetical protein